MTRSIIDTYDIKVYSFAEFKKILKNVLEKEKELQLTVRATATQKKQSPPYELAPEEDAWFSMSIDRSEYRIALIYWYFNRMKYQPIIDKKIPKMLSVSHYEIFKSI